jgi:hypothetical protein
MTLTRFAENHQHEEIRFPERVSASYVLLLLVVVILTSTLAIVSPFEDSRAVGFRPTKTDAAQVIVFEHENFAGGGTLVASNWVLTASHLFNRHDNPPSAYTLRFGIIETPTDTTDTTNLRTIDRIVSNPQLPDLVLVHFANPVPDDIWIPRLSSREPSRGTSATVYGWGASQGHVLNRLNTTILDPAATQNATFLRSRFSDFAATFPENIPPMTVNAPITFGDSGGGVFAPLGILAGVITQMYEYRRHDESGDLYGPTYQVSYQQPVWVVRNWILSVINGESTSGSGSAPGNWAPGRQLTEEPDDNLPMSLPPQTNACDESDASCTPPTWAIGTLLGSGNYRGTALAVCAQATEDVCSFDGTTYASGAIKRLPLGPLATPTATGTREVMVWCRANAVFTESSPARPALRVSFTNADQHEVPAGMGWWDVTPDQVGTGSGQTLVDPGQFATC